MFTNLLLNFIFGGPPTRRFTSKVAWLHPGASESEGSEVDDLCQADEAIHGNNS